MAELNRELLPEIQTMCQAGAAEAAEALGRALGGQWTVQVGQPRELGSDELGAEIPGPGLLVSLAVGQHGGLLLLPSSSKLVPGWASNPDVTQESQLATLALELGTIFLPDSLELGDAGAVLVDSLPDALAAAGPEPTICEIPLEVASGGKSGVLRLLWSVRRPRAAWRSNESSATKDAPLATSVAPGVAVPEIAAPALPSPPRRRLEYDDLEDGIRQLPSYARSLLKVRVPVTVTLASKKQPVHRILDLGPGSIIQFNKSCEDNLTLEVGDQEIARGEAVKVGDKFGLWITSMQMPEERFWAIKGKLQRSRVK